MSVKVQVSIVIDKPVAEVFRIHAYEHVRNHPRWDPFMQLEQVSDGPIGIGTMIKRINSRSGTPVEGTMEVVEFDPDETLGMVIHDGPVEMVGRVTYAAESEDRTRFTLNVEFPGMDESMADMLATEIEKAPQRIKQFIESELKE